MRKIEITWGSFFKAKPRKGQHRLAMMVANAVNPLLILCGLALAMFVYTNQDGRVYGRVGILNALINHANEENNPTGGMATNCGGRVFSEDEVIFTDQFPCFTGVQVKNLANGKKVNALVVHTKFIAPKGSARRADITTAVATALGVDVNTNVPVEVAITNVDRPWAGLRAMMPTARVFMPRHHVDVDDGMLKLTTQNILGELNTELSKSGEKMLADAMALTIVADNRVGFSGYPNTFKGVIRQGEGRKGCAFSWVCDGKEDPSPTAKAFKKNWPLGKKLAWKIRTDDLPPQLATLRYTASCAENYAAEKYFLQLGKRAPKWYLKGQKLQFLRGWVHHHTLVVNPRRTCA